MTDDIVKYLRLSRTRFNRNAEAADEIERLQKEVILWKKLWSGGQDEIEKLRQQNEFAHKEWDKAIQEGRKQAPEIDRLRKELLNALKPNLNSLVESRLQEEFLHKRIDVMEKALKLECESKIHWLQKCNKWRDIAEGFAKAHRYRFGLDGAWDKEYTAYEQGLRDDR